MLGSSTSNKQRSTKQSSDYTLCYAPFKTVDSELATLTLKKNKICNNKEYILLKFKN